MLDALISAGSKLVGGLLDRSDAKKQNEASNALAQQNIQLQKDFAQSGIQWKVADAEKAGVHPLYALGANTVSYSPVSMGQTSTSMGSTFSEMGQDISRAVRATSSGEDRAYDSKMRALNLQKAELENTLLSSQIARTTGAQIGPPMPTGASPDKMDPPPAPEHSGLRIFGKNTTHAPGNSDASKFEDRYGEIGEFAAGASNIIADGYESLRPHFRETWGPARTAFRKQFQKMKNWKNPQDRPRQSRYW